MRLRIAAVMMVLAPFVLGTTGCSDLPKACVEDVRYGDLTMESVELLFDVGVENPYEVPLPLRKMEFALSSGSRPFLRGMTELDASAPKHGVQTVTIPAMIDLAGFDERVAGVKPGAVVTVRSDLKLTVDSPFLGPYEIRTNTKALVPVPATPNVQVTEVAWSEFTWEKAVGTAKVRVGNTNTFAISVQRMEYRLALGGHELVQGVVENALELDRGAAGELTIPVELVPKNLGEGVFHAMAGEGAAYDVTGMLKLGTAFGELMVPVATGGQTPVER